MKTIINLYQALFMVLFAESLLLSLSGIVHGSLRRELAIVRNSHIPWFGNDMGCNLRLA
jgi:hypothetical protein